MAEKKGILLVAYGASTPVAQHSLALFEQQVRDIFPVSSIRWAFTSDLVRNRMAAAQKKSDSVEKALLRMHYEKFTAVAVQSLHIIPGMEYENLLRDVAEVSNTFGMKTAVGEPLLNSLKDVEEASEALLRHLPFARNKNEAVLCMGHGTWHDGGGRYAALYRAVSHKDPLVFLGTLEGNYSVQHILPQLRDMQVKKVWLLPLLSVVGKHAEIDMAGPQDNSWKSIVQKAGFVCNIVLKGTAEYENFIAIWIKHLKAAVHSATCLQGE